MRKKIRQVVLISIITLLLIGSININNNPEKTPSHPTLTFQEPENFESNPRWHGIFYGSVKSDKIRITLYDVYMNLKETGMISEYFENTTQGYFIELRDSNENSKLDSADKFIIHSRGEVQPNWGVILTYEPTGQVVASVRLSHEKSTLKEDNEDEYNPGIYLLLLELHICALAIILVIYHIRRE